jgi:hypothetical protein
MSEDPSAAYFAQPREASSALPPAYAPAYPAGPPGAGPWQEAPRRAGPRERPGVVVAAAVIAFVQAGLVFLGAAAIAVLAFGTRSALSDPTSNLAGLPVALGVVALVIAAVAGLVVLAAVHLLRGRAWAAVVLGVLEGLAFLSAAGDLAGQPGLAGLVGAGCSGAILVILVLPRTREFVGIS